MEAVKPDWESDYPFDGPGMLSGPFVWFRPGEGDVLIDGVLTLAQLRLLVAELERRNGK